MAASLDPSALLYSIQVGMPRSCGVEGAADPHDQPWTTGFYKSPVDGPVFATTTNLKGDGQADLKHHGGIDKAVLAYSADHYPKWRRELNLPDLPLGAFAENLTVSGLLEGTVHIGDVFRIGEARFEVSQPRQPCWKLARRWRMHELVSRVIQTGRTGWYFRVLQQGWVEPQMPVELVERPNPGWSIARANEVMYQRQTDLPLTLELAAVPKLSDSWVGELMERAQWLGMARPR